MERKEKTRTKKNLNEEQRKKLKKKLGTDITNSACLWDNNNDDYCVLQWPKDFYQQLTIFNNNNNNNNNANPAVNNNDHNNNTNNIINNDDNSNTNVVNEKNLKTKNIMYIIPYMHCAIFGLYVVIIILEWISTILKKKKIKIMIVTIQQTITATLMLRRPVLIQI